MTIKRRFNKVSNDSEGDVSDIRHKKPKLLKEEKILIRELRKSYRDDAIRYLTNNVQIEATEEEIELVLDITIDLLREKGVIDSLLDEYLQQKIYSERTRTGLTK